MSKTERQLEYEARFKGVAPVNTTQVADSEAFHHVTCKNDWSDLPKDERSIAERLAEATQRIRRLEAAGLVLEWAAEEGVPLGGETAEAVGKLVQWLREEG
jgi:hypothetical protein